MTDNLSRTITLQRLYIEHEKTNSDIFDIPDNILKLEEELANLINPVIQQYNIGLISASELVAHLVSN